MFYTSLLNSKHLTDTSILTSTTNIRFFTNYALYYLSYQASQIAFTLSTLLAMTCGHPSASGWQDNNIPSSSGKSGWQNENSGWQSGSSGWQSGSSGWKSESSGLKSGNSGWDDGSSHNFYDSSVSNDYVSRYIVLSLVFLEVLNLLIHQNYFFKMWKYRY